MAAFQFDLRQRVRVSETGEVGEIRTRLWHDTVEQGRLTHAYVVRFRRGDGTAREAWHRETALQALQT